MFWFLGWCSSTPTCLLRHSRLATVPESVDELWWNGQDVSSVLFKLQHLRPRVIRTIAYDMPETRWDMSSIRGKSSEISLMSWNVNFSTYLLQSRNSWKCGFREGRNITSYPPQRSDTPMFVPGVEVLVEYDGRGGDNLWGYDSVEELYPRSLV